MDQSEYEDALDQIVRSSAYREEEVQEKRSEGLVGEKTIHLRGSDQPGIGHIGNTSKDVDELYLNVKKIQTITEEDFPPSDDDESLKESCNENPSLQDNIFNEDARDSEDGSIKGTFTSTPHPTVVITDVDDQETRSFDFSNIPSFSGTQRLGLQLPVKKLSIGGISNIIPHSPNPRKILRDPSMRTVVLTRNHEVNYSINYMSVDVRTADLTTHSAADIVPIQRGLTLSCHHVTFEAERDQGIFDRLKTDCRRLLKTSDPVRQTTFASTSSQDISTESRNKPILKNISLGFPPGLNAVMGPSGCGKTSLLSILALRHENLQGSVRLNGNPAPKQFAQLCGFSVQDDVLNPTLSPREHLWFSMCLRRGGTLKKREKMAMIEDILRRLKLEGCSDVKIGEAANSKLSGGERKRTAIGMELAAAPKVLFLDEPTSALDSTTSKVVITILKKLADNGRTIILTIHQPSFRIYRLFNTLTLMARGRLVYHGPSSAALNYFTSLGFPREPYHSPPDFFMDILYGTITSHRRRPSRKSTPHPRRCNSVKQQSDHGATSYFSNLYEAKGEIRVGRTRALSEMIRMTEQATRTVLPMITVTPDTQDSYSVNNNLEKSSISLDQGLDKQSDVWFTTMSSHTLGFRNEEAYVSKLDATTCEGMREHTTVASWLSSMYLQSDVGKENEFRLLELQNQSLLNEDLQLEMKSVTSFRKSSFPLEFYLLTRRSLRSSKKLCCALVLMNALIGLLFGALYYHPHYDDRPMIQNRLGMFFYLAVHGMMVPSMITAKSFVISEKTLVEHERRSGYYRAITYCLGRCVVVIFARLLSSVTLSMCVYWLAGLRPTAAAFLRFFATTYTAGLACDTLCLLSAVGCRSFTTGRSVVVLYMSLTSVFAGFLLDLDSAFPWISWIKYISITRYCYMSWVIGEFSDTNIVPCQRGLDRSLEDDVEDMSGYDSCETTVEEIALQRVVGTDLYMLEHPWINHVILVAISVTCLSMCYLRMRKRH